LQQPLGVGIWFSDIASREVDLSLLRDTLDECGLTLFTINGFPFSDFHCEVVQHRVYEPNWCDIRRLRYTIRLANILASTIDEHEAGISTLPLGWNDASFSDEDAAKMLQQCIEQLEEIEQQTSRCIHLDLETEPGCRLQCSADLCQFVDRSFGDDERVRRYLRVCHDTCHAAVMRETPEDSIANYNNVGLSIGKVQLSSAIKINFEQIQPENLQNTIDDLRSIAEPRYLHQTTIYNGSEVAFFENLIDAPITSPAGEWRIHFHVPIHMQHIGSLQTTQDDLRHSIDVLSLAGVSDWEVETYTWDVLPTVMQEGELVESITKELLWATPLINQ
jgi:sugar phosphate isomerase/epimerase